MPVLDASLALKGPAGVTLEGAGVTALHLKGRGISGVDASLARACPSLAKLDLSDNVVRAGASVDALSRLSSLKNLNLANNDLDGAARHEQRRIDRERVDRRRMRPAVQFEHPRHG